MNEPFAPLPPAWRITNHFPTPMIVPDATCTVYQRESDGLRVCVTDAQYEHGMLRIVSASMRRGLLQPKHEKVVRKLFLKEGLPEQTEVPMVQKHVWARSQVIDGTVGKEDRAMVRCDRRLVQHLLDGPTETGAPVYMDEYDEDVTFFVTDQDDWWRYTFVRNGAGESVCVQSDFEFPERWLAVVAMVCHYESLHAPEGSRPYHPGQMPKARPIVGAHKPS